MHILAISTNNQTNYNHQRIKRVSFGVLFNKDKHTNDLNDILKDYKERDLSDYDTFEKENKKLKEEYKAEKKNAEKSWFFRNKKIAKIEEKYDNKFDGLKRGLNAFLSKIDLHLADLKLLEETLKARSDALDELADIKNAQAALLKAKEIAEAQKNNPTGLNMIAGYEKEKNILHDLFIDKMTQERINIIDPEELPKGILLYGPTGCGKSAIVNAIVDDIYRTKDEKDKYFVKIDTSEDSDAVIKKIVTALANARKNYINTNCRTIILLDEVEAIANREDTDTAEQIKAAIESADENYCTFFFFFYYPKEIEPGVIGKNRVEYHIPMDPPNKENMIKVLEYYFNKLDVKNLNYQDLADTLIEEQNKQNGRYSNSGIKSIYKTCKDIKGLSQEKIKNIIRNTPVNITEEEYNCYLEDKKEFGGVDD